MACSPRPLWRPLWSPKKRRAVWTAGFRQLLSPGSVAKLPSNQPYRGAPRQGWIGMLVFTRTRWGNNTRTCVARVQLGRRSRGSYSRGRAVKTRLAGAGFAEAIHWGGQRPAPFPGDTPLYLRVQHGAESHFCQAQTRVVGSRPCHNRPQVGASNDCSARQESADRAEAGRLGSFQMANLSASDDEVSEALLSVADYCTWPSILLLRRCGAGASPWKGLGTTTPATLCVDTAGPDGHRGSPRLCHPAARAYRVRGPVPWRICRSRHRTVNEGPHRLRRR